MAPEIASTNDKLGVLFLLTSRKEAVSGEIRSFLVDSFSDQRVKAPVSAPLLLSFTVDMTERELHV